MRAWRREVAGEVEDVAHGRGAERIDRLRVVADHGEAAPVGLERQQDRRLQPVGVLIFVDQDVVEARADLGRRSRARPACARDRAAGRRNRARSGAASPRHRRRTASSARPPSWRTTETPCPAPLRAAPRCSRRANRSTGTCPWSGKRLSVRERSSSWRTRFIRSAASSRSWIVKARSSPMRSAYSRSSRAPMAWNVPAQARPAAALVPLARLRMRSARRSISAAARREKVSSRMRCGSAPVMTRCATRCASVSVLPEPAPAMTSSGRGSAAADAVLDRRALVRIELAEIVHANHAARG